LYFFLFTDVQNDFNITTPLPKKTRVNSGGPEGYMQFMLC